VLNPARFGSAGKSTCCLPTYAARCQAWCIASMRTSRAGKHARLSSCAIGSRARPTICENGPSSTHEVKDAIGDVDKNLTTVDPRPLIVQVAHVFAKTRTGSQLIGLFAVVGLALACIGLYGLVSQAVTRRTDEIGVRIALGAARLSVLWLIMRETLSLVAIGLLVGIPIALASARLVRSQLFGLATVDPMSLAGAVVALLIVTGLARFLSARRALAVDPVIALRAQ
jgi:ABC-type antimicrobial peptide transport system permease subunit